MFRLKIIVRAWTHSSSMTAFACMHVCKTLHTLYQCTTGIPYSNRHSDAHRLFSDSVWDFFVQLEPLHVIALVPSCPFTHNDWSSRGTLILTLSRHGLLPTWDFTGLFFFSFFHSSQLHNKTMRCPDFKAV